MLSESQSSAASTGRLRAGVSRVTHAQVAATSAPRAIHTVPAVTPILATQHIIQKPYEVKDQKDRAAIGMLETAGGIAMAPLMLDMVTALLSKVLTLNGAIKGPWAAGVNGLLRSPMRALRDTELGDIKNLGVRVDAKRVEFNARESVQNAKLENRFNANKHRLNDVYKDAKPSKLLEGFERRANKVMELKPLKWLDTKFRNFAQWRHDRIFKSAQKSVEGIETLAKVEPKEAGTISKALNRTPKQVGAINYSSIEGELGALKGATNAKDLETASKKLIDGARELARNTKGPMEHGHIFKFRGAAGHVRNTAAAAHGWGNIAKAEGSAIANAMRGLVGGVRKASLFHVLFGVGAAAIATAKIMDGGRENRLEKGLLRDFAADVYQVSPDKVTKEMLAGKDAHPLVAQVAKAAKKAEGGRGTFGVVNAAAEVGNVATLKGAGGMLLMPWYGGPGMPGVEQTLHTMLVGENTTLQAYQHLRDAEAGKMQLTPEERMGRIAYMVSAVPGFANNHGVDNRLIKIIATDMVQQGLNTKQIMQVIADPEKIVPMARVAKEKLAEADAAAKAEAAAKVEADAPKPKFADKVESRSKTGSFAEAHAAEKAQAATQTTTRS